MALTNKLRAIGDAIRSKTGGTALLTLDEMPAEITAIQTGGGADLPAAAYLVSGDCSYRFANAGWDWFIENYGNKVVTQNITNASSMFEYSKVKEIPFELNFEDSTNIDASHLFAYCRSLRTVPKLNNFRPEHMYNFFWNCNCLREISEDFTNGFLWSHLDTLTSSTAGQRNSQFYNCYSLRSLPMEFLAHGNPVSYYTKSIYYSGFDGCNTLDEIVDLPNPHYNATWTSNSFYYTFRGCYRLKNMTFKCPNGNPYVVNWTNQTIALGGLGLVWNNSRNYVLNYNSGITADKEVYDDATYQALKNDKDWFTCDEAYSRYNHDSAVATINSLPDTSAYLAANGGTNTIIFNGESGSKTDGGAINTLTEEEIAVAAAKGWTVTLS